MATLIVGVKLGGNAKTYYFSPKNETFAEGDGVIVETVRGVEYGTVAIANKEVDDKEVVQPLKEVIRKATEEDKSQHEKNIKERDNLMRTTMKKVADRSLEMKIVDAEYTFDRSKIIVYFTAEGRVDFRELVKDLASAFHVRIELRQIYERDDIKMRGALAPCGRPCCCGSFLQNYDKVSIKMAKLQGLSLNPTKINGVCGKLMCCLRFENDFYAERMKEMPKVGSKVTTPDGQGTAYSNDIFKEEVKVKFVDKDGGVEYKIYPVGELQGFSRSSIEEVDGGEDQLSEDYKND